MTLKFTVVVALVACAGVAAQQRGQEASAEELLGKGLHQEQVEGDCRTAVTTYKEIPSRPGAKPDTVGRALLQLGGCYEKLGRPSEAQAAYRQIVQVVPSTSPTYSSARAKLAPRQEAAGDPLSGRVIDSYFQNASRVTASPTGRYVAYTKPKPGRSTLILGEKTDISMLYVRDLSGSEERVLFDPRDRTELISRILWSPDESAIAYVVRSAQSETPRREAKFQGMLRDLRVVNVQTAATVTVAAGKASLDSVQWSPNSQHLALDRRDVDFSKPASDQGPLTVAVWDRSTGTMRDVGLALQGRTGQPTAGLGWSPDGNRLAYVAADSGGKHVTIAPRAGGNPSAVALPSSPDGARVRLGGWHANGELIVIQNITGTGNDFYMVPTNGGVPRKVCEGRGASGGDGCTAPNTTNGFMVSRRNSEGGRAFLRDLVTGTEQALTDAAVLEQPFLLPSKGGKLIAFRSDRDGDFGVYLAPVDQLPARKPLRIATLDSPTSSASGWWTPDGLVLDLLRSDANIYRVDVDPKTGKPTSAPRRLTHHGADNQAASPSPDGKQIAYRLRDRQTGIGLMDANGTNERLLHKVPPDLLLSQFAAIGWRSRTELLLHGGRVQGKSNFSTVNTETGQWSVLSQPDIHGAGLGYISTTQEVFHWKLDRPEDGSGGEVWARSIATGKDRMVHKAQGRAQFFTMTKDGSGLFYSTANDSVAEGQPVPAQIHMVDLKTGQERLVLSFPNSKGAWNVAALDAWDRFLLYQDPDKRPRILDLTTEQSWPLLSEDLGEVTVGDLTGTWSPDGSYVLFTGFSERTERRQWTGLTYDTVVKLMQKR